MLRGKTLEEIFETWTTELNNEVKDFEKQANEVREWDRILVQNGSQVGSFPDCWLTDTVCSY